MKRAFLLYFILFFLSFYGFESRLFGISLSSHLCGTDRASVIYGARLPDRAASLTPSFGSASGDQTDSLQDKEISPSFSDSLLSSVCVYAYTEDSASEGSGIVYALTESPKGAYIVTNYHVIFSKESGSLHDEIKISPYALDKKDTLGIDAYTVGVSSSYDIALLWIDLSSYSEILISPILFREAPLCQGEEIYTVSNAMGKGLALSEGVISLTSEYIHPAAADSDELNEMLVCRISAPISKGSSGGGVFSSEGYFIALINAKRSDPDASHVGYAIPFESVRAVCDTLMKRGSLYSFIPAVTLSSVGKRVIYHENSLSVCESISVSYSMRDGGSLSLLQGDLLISVSIDGKEYPIRHINSFREALFYAEPDSDVIISIKRGGVNISLKKKAGADYFGYIP